MDGIIIIAGIICIVFSIINEREKVKNGTYDREREEERKTIERERIYAEYSQTSGTPWEKRYYTYPCPYCRHYKVRRANWDDKRMSVAFWGGASSKIGTNYKCEHCGRMWE